MLLQNRHKQMKKAAMSPSSSKTSLIALSKSKEALTLFESEQADSHNYGENPHLIIEHHSEFAKTLQGMLKQLVQEIFKQKRETIHFEYPNEKITECIEAASLWWSKYDPLYSRELREDKFVKMMIEHKVITQHYDLPKLLKSTIGQKVPNDGKIKKSQFDLMITKACIRAALMNIYYYLRKLTDRDYTDYG